MRISQKVRNITPSATLALSDKVADLRAGGVDVISLSIGEPDFNTPSNIGDVGCDAIRTGKTHYTPVPGIPELRRAISEKLKRENGLEYPPQAISVGTGAKQPIFDTILTLCDVGDEVIVPTPCWVSYVEMIKIAGGKPVFVRTKEEDGFQLHLDAIEAAVTPNTVAILINTPNNPTGAVYTEECLRGLAEIALRHDLMVISDEIYEKLIYNGKRHFSIGAVSPEMLAHTVTINGFSKAYAMTGWRLGYAAGPVELVKGMNAVMGHATSNASSIAQYAAVEALQGPQDSVEIMRREFDRRREMLFRRLGEMEGITCCSADGAFYLFPNITAFYGKTAPDGTVIRDSFGMADYLLDEAKVAVVPGAAFEDPDHLRISYATAYDAIEEAMGRMAAALKKLR